MERPAKKARCVTKAFENFTVAELKAVVERNDAFALKEANERIDQLEQQLSSKEKAVAKLSSVDARALTHNILKSIERQFQAQMLPEKDLSDNQAAKLTDKTSEGGREIWAFVPNVTSEVISELGLQYDSDGNIKTRFADHFFRNVPMKVLPGTGGACLRLHRYVSFKYTKAHSELKVIGYYQWSAKPKPKAKAKAKAEGESAAEDAATEVEGGGETAESGEAVGTAAPRKVAPSPAKPSPAKSPTPSRAAAAAPASVEAGEGMDVE